MTTRLHFRSLSSTQHYYHFLLGMVVPLILYREEHPGDIVIRSVGPLDRIIREIALPGVRISGEDYGADRLLTGMDHPAAFNGELFRRAATILTGNVRDLRCFGSNIDCVLIKRVEPDPFYFSSESQVHGGGSRRRSIPNHDELAYALTPCVNVPLDYMTLAKQIALFANAPVVVAQHGAALANMIFMRPGSHVVEIMPREILDERHRNPIRPRIFPELAKCLGIRHSIILQSGRHGVVDVDAVKEAVAGSLVAE